MRWIAVSAAVTLVALAGCQETQEEPPMSEAERVAQAAQEFDEATYDTVTWASDSAAVARGRDVFSWVCAECHGETGVGDGGRVVDGDTLHPPSFLVDDWAYADDPEALHMKIFVGNSLGMPHWGLRRLAPRDVVALERYIRLELIQQ